MFTSHTILMLRGQRQWRESLFEVEAKYLNQKISKLAFLAIQNANIGGIIV